MKFRTGDRVCALLVANRWGVDFTCFCGRLVEIEERGAVLSAKIKVTQYFSLYGKKTCKSAEFNLDIRVFKLMKWTEETKAHVIAVRKASRELDKLIQRKPRS